MNQTWTHPVTIPQSGVMIADSTAAEKYLRRHWADLPDRERAALNRRLVCARAGQSSHAAVRSAFVALIGAM